MGLIGPQKSCVGYDYGLGPPSLYSKFVVSTPSSETSERALFKPSTTTSTLIPMLLGPCAMLG